MSIKYWPDGNPDGGVIGNTSSDKLGFFGTAPTVKKGTTSFAQVAAATSTVATTTTLEVQAASLTIKVNTLLTELTAKGFIASA